MGVVDIPSIALQLAGFVLAHSAWIVSDLPEGELLAPFAIVEVDGERRLMHFEAETQHEAVSKGEAEMQALQVPGTNWAFVSEGLLPENGEKSDALFVTFWSDGMSESVVLVQRFVPSAGRGQFKLVGPMELVVDGRLVGQEHTQAALSQVQHGILSHEHVAELWPNWKED
jgi:hypothetical protein